MEMLSVSASTLPALAGGVGASVMVVKVVEAVAVAELTHSKAPPATKLEESGCV